MEEIIITNSDWIGERSLVRGKLNGVRYSLEEKIKNYNKKFSPAEKIYGSVEGLFIVQEIIHDRFKNEFDGGALVLGAYLGAKYEARKTETSLDGTIEKYFENRRINFSKIYPNPINELIELYIGAMSIRPAPSLEVLSYSFFSWCQKSTAGLIGDYYQEMGRALKGKEAKILDEILVLNFSEEEKGSEKAVRRSNLLIKENLLRQKKEGPSLRKIRPLHMYIAGHEEIIKEFEEINFRIVHKEEYVKYLPYRKILPNIILIGPPGTGKTTIVKSVAEAEGIYFAYIPCAQLFSSFYTETASNVDAVYETTAQIVKEKKYQGAYVFFDEFDAIARKRGSTNSSEDDKIITTLNERLDGGSTIEGLVTVAATNKVEMVSEALLNRFKILNVGYPENDGGVISVHEAIKRKINDYAGRELIGEIDYQQILPFSRQSATYKSGRVIERIMDNAILKKLGGSIKAGREVKAITTGELVEAYKGNLVLEKEEKYYNPTVRLH